MAATPLVAEGWAHSGAQSVSVVASIGQSVASARTEMLKAFLEELNAAGIAYCLLNGFQRFPEVIGSDVDFMVRPSDAWRIAPLLTKVARRCGAMLVQAIQHETGACYFVLAKQVGDQVAYLHPDCTTDYRRNGRLWLRANDVLQKRQRLRAFFVPATADEFLYYLIKKVLKQEVSEAHMRRLAALYIGRPEECYERLQRLWTENTVGAMVSAIVRRDLVWMRSHLPALSSELWKSAPVEGWIPRVTQRLGEWRRWGARAANPTGLSVIVHTGSAQQREEFAAALERNLRPAFRRTRLVSDDKASRLGFALWLWLARVRSTLVIAKRALGDGGRFAPDEIGFDLSREPEPDIERATRVALEYMAERLRRRMKLAESPETKRVSHLDECRE